MGTSMRVIKVSCLSVYDGAYRSITGKAKKVKPYPECVRIPVRINLCSSMIEVQCNYLGSQLVTLKNSAVTGPQCWSLLLGGWALPAAVSQVRLPQENLISKTPLIASTLIFVLLLWGPYLTPYFEYTLLIHIMYLYFLFIGSDQHNVVKQKDQHKNMWNIKGSRSLGITLQHRAG